MRKYLMQIEKARPRTITSCGGYFVNEQGDEFLYEQTAEDGQPAYAVWSLKAEDLFGELELEDHDVVYTPFKRLPWNPPSAVAPYDSELQLWQDVYSCIEAHWDHSDPAAYNIMTAWVFASWLRELWLATPYLFFFGPLESGKSRGLELLAELSMRGWLCLYTSPASLFRTFELWRPTLLLDEAEVYGDRTEITGLLNASYRKGSLVPRQRETTDGYETDLFDCYGFKAVAGTKELADTLESRCIRFKMSRAKRPLKMFIDKQQTLNLRNQLLMYRFNRLGEKTGKVRLSEAGLKRGYERFGQKLESARLTDLFFPLMYVAPSDTIRTEIYEFAQRMDVERWEELTASPEPIVLAAIIQARDRGLVESGSRIRIGDIADLINANLPEREQWSNRFVSARARALGFGKTFVHGRVAIRYDEKLVERLRSDPRYRHAFDPSGKQSPNLISHPKVDDWSEIFRAGNSET